MFFLVKGDEGKEGTNVLTLCSVETRQIKRRLCHAVKVWGGKEKCEECKELNVLSSFRG